MGTVWTVKGGRQGEREQRCLEHGVIGGGWESAPDLDSVDSREALSASFEQAHPELSAKSRAQHVSQLWSLAHRMEIGDLIVLKLKTSGTIAIGRVSGSYKYRSDLGDDFRQSRPVEWIATDVPRDAFDQDLLFSFGTARTIGQVQRERAEVHILAAVEGRRLPPGAEPASDTTTEADVVEAPDIDALAREQVRQYVSQRFAGHELARLVAAIVEALGFSVVEASPPGRDGGVDILAGSGPMGLDPPRVVAQVKTGQAGVDEYRALRGLVQHFQADQGLLVAWSGFRGTVLQEARVSHFSTRLWDADAPMEELFSVYDRLSEDLRRELPLKRLWALVPPE